MNQQSAQPRKGGRVTCLGWVLMAVVLLGLLLMVGQLRSENNALRQQLAEMEARQGDQTAARVSDSVPPEPAEAGQTGLSVSDTMSETSHALIDVPAASPLPTERVAATETPTSAPPTPTVTPTASPVPPSPTAAPPPATPVLMQGSGQQVTANFSGAGAMVTDFLHEGSGFFGVTLKDAATAERIELVANAIGAIRGSKLMAVGAGNYFYEVQADGTWALRTQPMAGWPRVGPAPQRFEGSGPMATGVFLLRGGRADFALAHNGEGFFGVTLYEAGLGARVELLANEIGAANVTKAVAVADGEYLVQVEADGAWTVQVTQ